MAQHLTPVVIQATHRATHFPAFLASAPQEGAKSEEVIGLAPARHDDVVKFNSVNDAWNVIELLSFMYGSIFAFDLTSYACIQEGYRG
jgi:hypothetical protein